MLSQLQCSRADLWGDLPASQHNLWTCRLFPLLGATAGSALSVLPAEVAWMHHHTAPSPDERRRYLQVPRLSLQEMLACSAPSAMFAARLATSLEIDNRQTVSLLHTHSDQPIQTLGDRAKLVDAHAVAARPQPGPAWPAWGTWLRGLDAVAATAPAPVAARALALIADALFRHVATRDPAVPRFDAPAPDAAVVPWAALASVDRSGVVGALAAVRAERLAGGVAPELATVRLYDTAVQHLIRAVVRTASLAGLSPAAAATPAGEWSRSTAPARLDLAGGWSDTPPLCYEHGGCVLNVGLLIDGVPPIGAQARRLPDAQVILRVGSRAPGIASSEAGAGASSALHEYDADSCVSCRCWPDVADFDNPLAAAALLKACLVAVGWVAGPAAGAVADADADAGTWLPAGGVEVLAWSSLPRGSGLGTSSIMAACILRALAAQLGRRYDAVALAHHVLMVEQLMTSGGGWQDQVRRRAAVYMRRHLCPRSLASHPSLAPSPPLLLLGE